MRGLFSVIRSRLLVLLLAATAASAVRGQTPVTPPAAEVARALQKRYETIRDFSARFTHTYEGGTLRRKVTEGGTVLIKKPARMRWTYSAPDQKVFVSDGERLYSYLPDDKQVIVSDLPTGDQVGTPTLFLAGKGNLDRDFAAAYADVPGAPRDTYALNLTPKQPERDYEWLILVVDRKTLQIRMLITQDQQGGRSTFTFTDLKENVGLPDNEFIFKIPRGVDVVRDRPPAG
jgi:outer membrane lipoprotein carrier protein